MSHNGPAMPVMSHSELTKREKEVVLELLEGGRIATIAELFGVSPRTVSNHLKSSYRKLDVHSVSKKESAPRHRRGSESSKRAASERASGWSRGSKRHTLGRRRSLSCARRSARRYLWTPSAAGTGATGSNFARAPMRKESSWAIHSRASRNGKIRTSIV